MTGPGHYAQAEECLGWAEGEHDRDKRTSLHARAQVHATLTLAAVAFSADMTAGEWPGWMDAAASQLTRQDAAA